MNQTGHHYHHARDLRAHDHQEPEVTAVPQRLAVRTSGLLCVVLKPVSFMEASCRLLIWSTYLGTGADVLMTLPRLESL